MNQLNQFAKLMRSNGIGEDVIRTFSEYYKKLAGGEKGYIDASAIHPPTVENLVDYESIAALRSQSQLKHIVVIKLNGGLGTSMGLSKAKSLLPVKGNMNFLDIITRQVLSLRASSGYDVQLLFMNSYNTESDTLDYLKRYPDLSRQELPISFVQNKFPRVRQDNLAPFESSDKEKMWNPPGHGDIYTALSGSGLLEKLIERGYRYAFVSNSDNLGATVDTCIPAYMEKHKIHFLMEVCHRTDVDKKGGHLAEDAHGRLLLREVAQTTAADMEQFQDVSYYKYFNTNNLWIDLKALQWNMISGDGVFLLPLIINPKTVDGLPVFQLETAMGAAISIFTNSQALVVPRTRFAPVKKNTDLVAIWSDAYELNDQYQIVLRRGIQNPPEVELDPRFYGNIDDLLQRFKQGVPSLAGCRSLKLSGDISFGEDVICEGKVSITASQPVHLKSRLMAGEVKL
jgi:UTP--glucose-1-phosphate uridylyltransferase